MSLDRSANSLLKWLDGDRVKPYVFVREDMRVQNPGSLLSTDWFPWEPLWFNPLRMDQVEYADQILNMEEKAFSESGLAMPRWVFYDCAIMPGFVAGFAHRTADLPAEMSKVLGGVSHHEWTPISLFIIIPTMREGEWFAHNLSSVNSLLPRESKFYGLGFLTKCFGLWYANIETCCGATQWQSPALRLHSQYGAFEVLTAYTPVHDYPNTITYRLKVEPQYWSGFFAKQPTGEFLKKYTKAGFKVDPKDENSLKSLQTRIEAHEGPYFLNPSEIRVQDLKDPLNVYVPSSK